MHASLDLAGLEHPIVAERFACGAEQRQQNNRECIDQPQPITPRGRVDMDRSQTQAEAQILRVPQSAFNPPATTVQGGQLLGRGIGTAGCLLYTSDAADERSSVDLGG